MVVVIGSESVSHVVSEVVGCRVEFVVQFIWWWL